MPIQWFPGHMHSTRKAIVERLPDIDVVIELLDARLPGSSGNPLLAALTAGKPALKVLNKQDLADPALTAAWQTSESAPERPTVLDELEHVGFYLTEVLYRVLPTYVSALPLPQRLRDVGVTETELSEIAHLTMSDYMMGNLPRPMTEDEVLALLRSVW